MSKRPQLLKIKFNLLRNQKLDQPVDNSCVEDPNGKCMMDLRRRFGDYQYYMSFGGDQYFDLIRALDAIYGTSGIIIQLGHFISQASYEMTGYAAMGE